jgi:hypothetical protein
MVSQAELSIHRTRREKHRIVVCWKKDGGGRIDIEAATEIAY